METQKINGIALPQPYFRSSTPYKFPLEEGTMMGTCVINAYQGKGQTVSVDEDGNIQEGEGLYPIIIVSQKVLPSPEDTSVGVPLTWYYHKLVGIDEEGSAGPLFNVFGPQAHVIFALDDGEKKIWKEYFLERTIVQPEVESPLTNVDRSDPIVAGAEKAGLDVTDPVTMRKLRSAFKSLMMMAQQGKVPFDPSNVNDPGMKHLFEVVKTQAERSKKPTIQNDRLASRELTGQQVQQALQYHKRVFEKQFGDLELD